MTKVVRLHEFGGPEVLRYEDVEIAPPGPGEVRLRQRAVGLNFIDIYHRSGVYPNQLPLTPGSEASGDVVAVGPDVTEFKVGDRVAYGTAIGAYAEERNIPAAKLVHLPAELSYDVGAVIMLKGLTAQYLLRQTHRVVPGDIILVQAAAGGMGLILCQWAKALGATVIGTAGSEEKAALAKAHGADHVILYTSEDVGARVREITGGRMCDVAYDGVGKATFPAVLDALRPRGLFVSFGNASGSIEAFNILLLMQKGSLYATRPTLATYASTRENLLAMTKDVTEVLASGAVRMEVRHRFALKDAAEAHRALAGRETTGATVLIP